MRAWAAQIAHYRVASRLRKYNLMLGLPVVIFTTVVGTSLFATLSQDELPWGLRVGLGCVSVVAAILAGIQTFLNFAKASRSTRRRRRLVRQHQAQDRAASEHAEEGPGRSAEVPR